MENINIQDLIKYWLETAEYDYKTMLSLFKSKRYSDSLFYGHLVLEKILKALAVQKTKNHAKPIHNLIILAEDAKINFSKDDLEFLTEVNKFNIRARYPDYKLSFYKICDLNYTKPKLTKIKLIYKKLCKELKTQN